MKKILVVDDESGIDLTVNLNDVRDVYRHVCDILIQRVSMDSPHDHILINIKDQLKDYIDKCLTAQEAPEPEPEKFGRLCSRG
jgi:hypothetical protein